MILTMFNGSNSSVYLKNYFDMRQSMYTTDPVATALLISLYVPTFIVAVAGNILALIILTRASSSTLLAKNLYLVNLVASDLAGKFRLFCYKFRRHNCITNLMIFTKHRPTSNAY